MPFNTKNQKVNKKWKEINENNQLLCLNCLPLSWVLLGQTIYCLPPSPRTVTIMCIAFAKVMPKLWKFVQVMPKFQNFAKLCPSSHVLPKFSRFAQVLPKLSHHAKLVPKLWNFAPLSLQRQASGLQGKGKDSATNWPLSWLMKHFAPNNYSVFTSIPLPFSWAFIITFLPPMEYMEWVWQQLHIEFGQ